MDSVTDSGHGTDPAPLVAIRVATENDAASVAELAAEFHAYLRGLGDRTGFTFSASDYLRDGFGAEPAFTGLVGEVGRRVVAYLLMHFGYDTDRGRREAYVDDLYVVASFRGHGFGTALMREAARLAASRGARALWWGVYERNVEAVRFYERLGAHRLEGVRFMTIEAEALKGRET